MLYQLSYRPWVFWRGANVPPYHTLECDNARTGDPRRQRRSTTLRQPEMLAGDRLFLHRVGSSAEVFPVPIEFIRQAPQLSNGLRVAISAGLILRQAILAGLAKRILILTPKSVHENLELPPFPELPLVLRDLDRSINLERARPPEIEWRPLDAGAYSIGLPGGAPIRVTTDAQVFDFSADGH